MKKIIFIGIILGITKGILFAQSQFVKTLGGTASDVVRFICLTP